jgi:hypothetical protein
MSETSVGGTIEVRVGARLVKNAVAATAIQDYGSFDLTLTYQ